MPLTQSDLGLSLKITYKDAASAGLKATNTAITGTGKAAKEAAATASASTRSLQTEAQRAATQIKLSYSIIGVRSMKDVQREIDRTRAAFNRLAKSGTLSATAQKRAMTATTQKIKALKAELKGVNRASTLAAGGMRRLLAAAGSGLLIQQLARASDQYVQANALLKVASKSTKDFTSAQAALGKIVKETRGDWSATITLYARLARSTRELGVPQRDLLIVTKALNQAAAVSGATSIEASNALIQLSQGMASGTLRGDELRSVLEQIPRVGAAIAKGMGISFGQLRQMGQEGKLTTQQVISALKKQAGVLQSEFNKMPPTINQAMTQIHNEFVKFIGTEGEASGVSVTLANGLLGVADGIKHLDAVLPPVLGSVALLALRSKGITVASLGAKAGIAGMTLSLSSMIKLAPAIKAFAASFAPLAAVQAMAWGINSTFDALNKKQDKLAAEERNRFAVRIAAMRLFNSKRAEFARAGIDTSKVDINNTDQVIAALERLKSSEFGIQQAATKAAAGQRDLANAIGKDISKSVTSTLKELDKLHSAMQTQVQRQASLREKLFRATGGGAKGFFNDQVGALKTDIKAMLQAGIGQQYVSVYMQKKLDELRQQAVKSGASYQADSLAGLSQSAQTMVQTMANNLKDTTATTDKLARQLNLAAGAAKDFATKALKIMPANQAGDIATRMDTIIGKFRAIKDNSSVTTAVRTAEALQEIAVLEQAITKLTRPRTIAVSVQMAQAAQMAASVGTINPVTIAGSRATGGMISRDGMYYMHAGERVVSNNSQSFGDINIIAQNGMPGDHASMRALVRNVLMPELAAASR